MTVSLVIPTFNRAVMLRELLVSVAAQSHRPVEVVIVDDASTDDTASVVREFFAQQSHDDSLSHSYERLEGRSGAPVARNRGVALAQGDAVMFVDSDDILAADGIGALAQRLDAEPGLAYAFAKVAITGPRTDPAPNSWRGMVGEPFGMHPDNICGYHWHTMGALYRSECVERVGTWNVELTGSQDWEFQARVKMFGGKGAFVDCLVGYWRQHANARVGTSSFRADYVGSAAKACCSIWAHACAAHKGNQPLAAKLARRLMRHALEWGAAGYGANKRSCLRSALEIAGSDRMMTTALRICMLTPSWLDRSLVQITDARARIS
jgi:Glycosyl transferase family 2